jgi:hypothetical protein
VNSALPGDPVDVGRASAHHSAVVGTDIPHADIVAHDDDDVGFLARHLSERWRCAHHREHEADDRNRGLLQQIHVTSHVSNR